MNARILAAVMLFFSLSTEAQKEATDKFSYDLLISAQTPFKIPNGFYNKNYQTTNYFRSGYGLRVNYRINTNWQFTGGISFYQSFVQQHFYFDLFDQNANFSYSHISPEIGLCIGFERTLVVGPKSRLSLSIEFQPWKNLLKAVTSDSRNIPDGIGGFKASQVNIKPNKKLKFSNELGLSYDYFGKTLIYGFAIELHGRQSGPNEFDFVVDDWFTYSWLYSTNVAMLSFSTSIGF